MEDKDSESTGPLEGLRVLEMGQLLAGPFASVLLAWFGAEVIKVEPPGVGDPLRTWRGMHEGTALWWYILGRNKKCVTINLRMDEGRDLVRKLVPKVDVVLENFKPGRMEAWGLGPEQLRELNPELIFARVSGWGQTGPKSSRPGYASVAEGVGGLRYVTGYPDRPPVRSNLSLGDTLAGLHAALGILMAVYHRDVRSGSGQVIDVAIYEAVFNMMESVLPEYDLLGEVRERQGTKLNGIVPTNTYLCKDGKYVIIGGNGDSIYKRLMKAIGREDLGNDRRLTHNDGRVKHEKLIDDAISDYTSKHSYAAVIKCLDDADVPAGPIYSIEDLVKDRHFQAREMFEEVSLDGDRKVKIPNLAPKLSQTPGGTRWIGPSLGEHNVEVFQNWLGLSEKEVDDLRSKNAI